MCIRDRDAYVKTSGELEPGCTTSIGSTAGMVGDNVDILGKNAVRVSALSPSGDPVTLNAGKIATVTFMATENITAENARIEVKTEALPDYDTLEDVYKRQVLQSLTGIMMKLSQMIVSEI